jgi:hypothetical protein
MTMKYTSIFHFKSLQNLPKPSANPVVCSEVVCSSWFCLHTYVNDAKKVRNFFFNLRNVFGTPIHSTFVKKNLNNNIA